MVMQLDGDITILVDGEKVKFEFRDEHSRVRFLVVEMDPVQFCAALGRLAHRPIKMDFRGLDKIGKVQEHRTMDFPMPEGTPRYDRTAQKMIAREEAERLCSDGWEPDPFFNSQDSFFDLDGFMYARTTIRRWV